MCYYTDERCHLFSFRPTLISDTKDSYHTDRCCSIVLSHHLYNTMVSIKWNLKAVCRSSQGRCCPWSPNCLCHHMSRQVHAPCPRLSKVCHTCLYLLCLGNQSDLAHSMSLLGPLMNIMWRRKNTCQWCTNISVDLNVYHNHLALKRGVTWRHLSFLGTCDRWTQNHSPRDIFWLPQGIFFRYSGFNS